MTGSGEGASSQHRFGKFLLDLDRLQLLDGDREVSLSPKAFRVLELLVRNAGEVITKDRLLDEIWADVHVLEGVVKVCIAEIRKALGETGARPRHLHTVQRRGYRFEMPEPEPEAREARNAAGDSLVCVRCGATVAAGGEFCSGCGARQGGVERAPAAPIPSADAPPEPVPKRARAPRERRQLTVVFCGGFDSARESGQPESADLREACRTTCVAIIRSLGGRISVEDGDRLIAYFGHPRSREDDGLRAVRASLRILERVPAINARLAETAGLDPVELRVGVSTGLAIVGGEADHAAPSLDETGELAAQLAAESDSGTITICAATRSLLRDSFELEERAAAATGDLSANQATFRVIRERQAAADRTDASEVVGRKPMVGRDQEVALLLDRWAKVREGQGQAVLISGEAGIGKSKLVQVLRERIGEHQYGWIELRGSAYHQNSAFRPVIELLRRAFRFASDDAPEEQVARLEMGLEQAGLPVDDMLPFFTDLLALPLLQDTPTLQLSPELQRSRTLEAMCAWLFGLADQRPLVVVAEDLHWTDPSTTELLGMLIEHGQWYPMLIVATHRPEFVPPWSGAGALAIPLDPLGRKEVDALVESIAGGKRVPRAVREHILSKGDGVPLFIEELTRSVLDSELLEESDQSWERTDPLPGWSVPSTLQDSLEARLDRLGAAKEILQLASALGRDFSLAELEALSEHDAETTQAFLEELMGAGLLFRRGVPPRAVYAFKHALIQDIAYRSLLPETRIHYHAAIAETLEARFPELFDAEPEAIARHFEEGGLTARAIEAYEHAGRRAAERSADREAVAHFRKALDLVTRMPASPERDEREIRVQIAIGTPLAASRGFGSPEVQEAYTRARDLLQEVDDPRLLGEALDGLVSFYITQSQLADASTLVDQQLQLAEAQQDAERLLSAHYCLGVIHYFQGDPRKALDHFGECDALYDPDAHRDLLSIRGENVGVAIAIWSAWALWIRGFPDRAVEACRDAVDRANEVGHQFSLAYAHAWTSVVHWNRRDRPEAIEHSESAIAVAQEFGFPIPLGVARLVRLRCRPDGPMTNEDLEDFQKALAELAATGTQAAVPQILAGIGEYCLERNRPEWAPGYVDGALAVSAATGQPHWDAEAYRAKAALLGAQKPDALEEIEALLRRALEISADQHARSLELRAAIDLSRLLRECDREGEAREILEPIVSWFEINRNSPDLAIARELLEAD